MIMTEEEMDEQIALMQEETQYQYTDDGVAGMIKSIKQLFCKHEYKVISPEFCMGKKKMARLCECQKCGKNKIV